ncbi:17663_t:CDS:2 [Funneliformis caledonium]|uniref:17663_t:CDS:1 n=1 Tax=Funneliformis caledonium TaxID=1117310 RepID=A0A9N9CG77_9GLOM|nr:17663_t:CDS:2 [Funneliformis caledonium]
MSTSLNTITNKNKPELKGVHKIISNLQLKSTQEDSLNDFLVKLENHMTMVVEQIKTNEYTNDFKTSPYDSTPILVTLIRNKMKTNELDDEDSNDLIENEFAFDYSKSFTNKANQKILKAYLLFYMKEYESWDDNFKELIRQICNTYFETRRNILKALSEKSKAIKTNNQCGNRTLKMPCSISPDFPQWAIKLYNLNTILSNAVDPDSEDDSVFQDITNDLIINSQPEETFNYGLTDSNNTHDQSSSHPVKVLSEDAIINQKSAGLNKKQSNNIKKRWVPLKDAANNQESTEPVLKSTK